MHEDIFCNSNKVGCTEQSRISLQHGKGCAIAGRSTLACTQGKMQRGMVVEQNEAKRQTTTASLQNTRIERGRMRSNPHHRWLAYNLVNWPS